MDNSKKPEKENPRASSNPLSQLIFLWIIPFLFRGTTRGLNTDDLTKCMEKDHSEVLGDKLETEWEKELLRSKRKNKEPSLRNALFKTFIGSCIVDGILCFLFVLIKSLQPIVLGQLLVQFQSTVSVAVLNSTDLDINRNLTKRSLNDFETNLNSIHDDLNKNTNPETSKINEILDDSFIHYIWNDIHWLASILVSMTLLGVFFNHHSDLRQRLVGARMRIACCSMIYRKTLKLSKKTAGQTAAGYIVNLLSNDVGRLDYGFIFAHYIWILPFQSVLICYLIYREIGVAALVGVIGLLLKTIPVQTGLSRLSSMLRMKVAIRTDSRVGIMNELIQGIQVIKMYAWEKPFHAVVSEARRKEVKQIRYSSYIRGVFLSTMVFTERSTLFITIAACVWMKQAITADIVFSMAQYFNVLQLTAAIFYPLAVSMGAEALVSITRVQEFLMQEEHDSTTQGLKKNVESDLKETGPVLTLSNLTASWDENSKKRTLENISVDIPKGQLYAVIGPVGSGKSSLLQLLLGELPIHSGNVVINGEVSYASQEPWLFTGSVRNNILFGLDFDQKRYKDVVKHCALLTDFAQLPNGDKTVVGERGASLSGGQRARISLARAVYKKASVYLLDDPLSAVDSHVGKHLFDEVIGPKGCLAGQKCTRILVTHQVHFLKEADWIIILEDGKISKQGTYRDLSNSELDFAKLLERLEEESSNADDKSEINDEDEEIPYIDGYVGVKQRSASESSSKKSLSKSRESGMDEDVKETAEDQAQGGISFRVWRKYFGAGGNFCILFLLFSVLIVSQVVTSGSDYFVNYWTQQEFLRLNNVQTQFTNLECLLIYGILIIGVVLITIFRSYLFFKICMTASKCLHNKMFANLLNAPMRFFDTNPSGRILNRFSKDMGAIDELLPRSIMDAIQISLVMVGILAMVSIVNPSLLLALCGAVFLFVIVLKLYLRPAQDLKRLEGICRSPVFSHLSATLNGLSTIRANGAQEKVADEFDGLQDVHSAVWQLTMSSNCFLGIWLDIISTGFVACVTFSFILRDEATFSGNVGLAICQSLILTGMVQYGVRMCAESIQLMTSVERVLQYTDLEPEFNPKKNAPKDWPQHGKVEFKKMSLRYSPNDSPVLKNLQIVIEPSWKVGIVGRTGAGKSSLIGALFRLANVEGKILIDDVDTGSISLEDLRTNVSIIPQDPVLFSATIRYNLDPFDLFDDKSLWEALEDVELKNQVGHLDFMVTEGGSNFSVGQRQLICLARAILRNNKVLVLDEATANVDPQTDALIQKTIRVKFKNCTVLTVAHRLHTVMDSDRILVMDAGFAKEFDIPHNLIQKDSLLRDMIEATGGKESESLKKIAAENFLKKTEANQGKLPSNGNI